MATRHSRDHLNPLKKKFISPNSNRKSPKFSNISPKFKSNLKEFPKHSQGKKEGNLKKKLYEMKKEKRERYHLGGNSSDPLNLNSLINREPMLSTPQASPLPTHGDSPIDVCYLHRDDDPLNLKCFPDKDLKEGVTPKKKKKKKNKNNQNDIENKGDKDENKVELSKEKKKKKKQKKAKANSTTQPKRDDQLKEEDVQQGNMIEEDIKEVTKQEQNDASESSDNEPPAKKMRKNNDTTNSVEKNNAITASNKLPRKEEKHVKEYPTEQESSLINTSTIDNNAKQHSNFKEKKHQIKKTKVFIYGNYNHYYNYRNPQCSEDLRLKIFSKDWFSGKDVLDIGCNAGDITISIAKQFEPRIIIGNDIDNSLIKIAKSKCQASVQSSASTTSSVGKMKFPMSFSVTNGPIAVPMLLEKDEKLNFPNNIIFKQENYVPPDDKCLANQKPMYDTILCLSVTKWIHLNWGDQGLKRMFKKIYKNLRPGGRLVLEPQPFGSYKKRRKLTDKIRANYDSICFRPEQFIDYLLSEEVGFIAYEVLEEPQHGAPGFRRPIYLFTKANTPKS